MKSLLKCGSFSSFLSLRFYVKSILGIGEVKKLPFWQFQRPLNLEFNEFVQFLRVQMYQKLKIRASRIVKWKVFDFYTPQNWFYVKFEWGGKQILIFQFWPNLGHSIPKSLAMTVLNTFLFTLLISIICFFLLFANFTKFLILMRNSISDAVLESRLIFFVTLFLVKLMFQSLNCLSATNIAAI